MNAFDLKAGDRLQLVGAAGYEKSVFTVTGVRMDIAECDGEQGRLLIPLCASLPFAVMVLREERQQEESAEEPVKEDVPVEAAEPVEAVVEETEKPAEPETAEASHDDKAEEKSEEQPVIVKKPRIIEPLQYDEDQRYTNRIQFFNEKGCWGKIDHPGTERGLFFHASQVEDDQLRALLFGLEPGEIYPAIKVSYQIRPNARKANTLYATAIRAEEPVQDAGKPAEGSIVAYHDHGTGSVMIDDKTNRRMFMDQDVDDPYLYHFLKNACPVNEETEKIEVSFVENGKRAHHLVWTNRGEQQVEITEEELKNWTECGSRFGETKVREVPPYQP